LGDPSLEFSRWDEHQPAAANEPQLGLYVLFEEVDADAERGRCF
jgi:hypothetical protein